MLTNYHVGLVSATTRKENPPEGFLLDCFSEFPPMTTTRLTRSIDLLISELISQNVAPCRACAANQEKQGSLSVRGGQATVRDPPRWTCFRGRSGQNHGLLAVTKMDFRLDLGLLCLPFQDLPGSCSDWCGAVSFTERMMLTNYNSLHIYPSS